jgi:hypothetical protein
VIKNEYGGLNNIKRDLEKSPSKIFNSFQTLKKSENKKSILRV